MTSAAEHWLHDREADRDEDAGPPALDQGTVRRRIQRARARVVNRSKKPKFRKDRRQQAELTRKGNLTVPLRDHRPLSLVRSHEVEVKDARLGDPVCWKAELESDLDSPEVDVHQEKLSLLAPAVSREDTDSEDSYSPDPEDTIDPEILELIGETVEDPEGPEVLGVSAHPTYGKAPTANRVRRMLMQPAEIEFDPTDHEHYTLDREPGCIALKGGYLT